MFDKTFILNLAALRGEADARVEVETASAWALLVENACAATADEVDAACKAANKAAMIEVDGKKIQGPQYKTTANISSRIRAVWGAVHFAALSVAELATAGQNTAERLAIDALRELGVNWRGQTSEERKETSTKRKQVSAAVAAFEEALREGRQISTDDARALGAADVAAEEAKAAARRVCKVLAEVDLTAVFAVLVDGDVGREIKSDADDYADKVRAERALRDSQKRIRDALAALVDAEIAERVRVAAEQAQGE